MEISINFLYLSSIKFYVAVKKYNSSFCLIIGVESKMNMWENLNRQTIIMPQDGVLSFVVVSKIEMR